MRLQKFLVYLVPLFSVVMQAQMNACPEHPVTLDAMRDCYRPVIVFAPAASDPRLRRQLTELSLHGPELQERNILVVIDAADHQTVAIQDLREISVIDLGPVENKRLRDRFKVSSNSFVVLLVGKDGGEKLRKQDVVAVETLNHTIDAMPMRQAERGHK